MVLRDKPAIDENSLAALAVRLGGILQETGVLDGDLVTVLWDGTVALADDGLGNTHDCGCAGEAALIQETCSSSSESWNWTKHGEKEEEGERNVWTGGGGQCGLLCFALSLLCEDVESGDIGSCGPLPWLIRACLATTYVPVRDDQQEQGIIEWTQREISSFSTYTKHLIPGLHLIHP
jgi:hypothetical protein